MSWRQRWMQAAGASPGPSRAQGGGSTPENAVTLPEAITFDSGQWPANQGSRMDLVGPSPTLGENNAASTVNGWNPSTEVGLSAREAKHFNVGVASYSVCGFTFSTWNTNGKVVDTTKEVRIQLCYRKLDAWYLQPYVVLHNYTSGYLQDAIFGSVNVSGFQADTARVGTRVGAVDDYTDYAYPDVADAPSNIDYWHITELIIPAGLSGDVQVRMRRPGTSSFTLGWFSHTITQDFSGIDLDAVSVHDVCRSTDGFDSDQLYNYLWVGSGDDAWPV